MVLKKIVSWLLGVCWLVLVAALLYRFLFLDTPQNWQESDNELVISFFHFQIFPFLKYLAGFVVISLVFGVLLISQKPSSTPRMAFETLSFVSMLYIFLKLMAILFMQQKTMIRDNYISLHYSPLASSHTLDLNTGSYEINYSLDYHIKRKRTIINSFYKIFISYEKEEYILLTSVPKNKLDETFKHIKSKFKQTGNPEHELFSDRVVLSTKGETLELILRPRGLTWGVGLFLVVFFTIFIAFGTALIGKSSYKAVWGSIFAVFLIGILYLVLVQTINRQTLAISPTEIICQNAPLPYWGNISEKITDSEKIVKIYAKESVFRSNYQIAAELSSGRSIQFLMDSDDVLIRRLAEKLSYELHLKKN